MYCHCTVCNSTFNASIIRSKYEIPCKCPDCGKKVSAPRKPGGKSVPAVRAATEEEIKEYEAFRRSEVDRVFKELHKDWEKWEDKHSSPPT